MVKVIRGVVLGLMLVLVGCSGGSSANSYTIGVSISTLTNPFFETLADSIEDAAEDSDLDIKVVVTDAKDDVSKQLTDVDDLIAKNVDLVIINPVDSDSVITSVEALNDNDIPVITVDRAANSGEVISHIASDNQLGGQLAAEYAIDNSSANAKTIILEGIPGASATIERGEGFETTAANKLDIVAKSSANFNRQEGLNVAEDLLAANPDATVLFAHNDEMALGAIEAVGDKDIIIIGFDATDDGVDAIEDGKMDATIAQQPELLGKKAFDEAVKYFNDETVEPVVQVEVKLVTKEKTVD